MIEKYESIYDLNELCPKYDCIKKTKENDVSKKLANKYILYGYIDKIGYDKMFEIIDKKINQDN